ncbi:hypothetical protein C5167_041954 [Papaver somniferum]|nr:hypothetical protein C5167_041954 [Papaver somniferum]
MKQGGWDKPRGHQKFVRVVQTLGNYAMVHDNMFKAIRELCVFNMIRSIMSMSTNASSNSKSFGRASWLIGTFVEAIEGLEMGR